ncbi:S-adenosyl-L-methionine-dependent methyltransferase [Podospora aff. communis PSN243]|uniref:S-adenosyl-L-methionine-dependent methyltransferase n=1 Tax=Podospora aff. communis PSN243 TaxID=3040156 RepID=A0AAV9GCQ1_9PEZI|nr:S-adenosyl-L-methionine-dependent methyltransferase [Podospora aff. communis PSN243]
MSADAVGDAILPAAYWEERHVADDADSSLGDDLKSSTASVTSSVLAYRTLHGRRYHSDRVTDGDYWGPNDEQHSQSVDLVHHCLCLVFDGKLTMAPLEKDKVKNVVDIGTGTGIWAIDFADEYPDCQVVGTDISPIQPTWVPPNCRFEIEDATKPWTFAPESFDFIHMRYMYGSVVDWNALFAEMYRATKPGGWVETMEPSSQFESDNNTVVEGTALYEWGKVFYEAGRKSGRTFSVVEDGIQEKGLKAAGFVDVKVIEGKSPLNGYMKEKKWKEIGMYSQVAFEQDIEGYALFIFTHVMGWTPEQTRVYAAAFRKQLRDPNCHPYFRYKVVIGRKPEKKAEEKAAETTT